MGNSDRSSRTERLWTKDFIFLTLANLFLFMNLQMITPALPVYVAERFGGHDMMVSLVIVLFAISAVITRIFTGKALVTANRKTLLLVGLITFALATAGYYWVSTLFLFLVIRVIYGIGFGIAGTTNGTMVSDVIPTKRIGEGMGYFGLSTSLSMSLAPVIGIWLLNDFGFGTLIAVAGACAVIVIPLMMMIRISKKTPVASSAALAASAQTAANPQERKQPSWIDRKVILPCVLSMLLSITYGGLVSFIALYGKEAGLANAGLFFLFNALMVLLVRPFSGKIFDRKGPGAVLPFGAMMSFIGIVMLSYTTSTVMLIVSALFYGVGYGVIQPSLQAWALKRVTPDRRGVATGAYYNSIDLGIAIGSFLLGAIATATGYAMMYRLSAAAMIVFLLLFAISRMVEKSRKLPAGRTEAKAEATTGA